MSKHPNKLNVKKGSNIKVSIDKGKWTSLVDGTINLVTGNYIGAGKSLFDLAKGVKFGKGIEGKAEELIFSALFIAIDNVLSDFEKRIRTEIVAKGNPFESDAYKNLIDSIVIDFEASEIILSPSFISQANKLSFLEDFKPKLIEFFKLFEIHPNDCISLSESLNFYFVLGINEAVRTKKYDVVFEHFESPFNETIERELNWQRYHESLVLDTKERVFGEDFRIKDLYIPLRAYYKVPVKQEQKKTIGNRRDFDIETPSTKDKIEYTYNAFKLEDYLDEWLARPKSRNIEDYFLMISGGPGAGKSTVTKMWAAKVGQQGKFRVLYIPLGGGFSFNDEVNNAVNDFVASQRFIDGEQHLFRDVKEATLIIFDGLDELNKQGKDATEQARLFIGELKGKIRQLTNSQKELLKIIVSGREIAVQQCEDIIKKPITSLHLLPYVITTGAFGWDTRNENNYEEKLKQLTKKFTVLNENQREIWWANYIKQHNAFKGGKKRVPKNIKEGKLDDITTQPLLNFLLSLSWEGGNVNFDADLNLNEVYNDLLKRVHERDCKKEVDNVTEQFNFIDFKTIMQQIGLAAWQNGDTRSLKAQHLEDYTIKSELNVLLEQFKQNSRQNVSRLFMAFYFKQSQSGKSENIFYEFTHKSFGEYLTATGLFDLLNYTHEQLKKGGVLAEEKQAGLLKKL